MNGFPDKFIRYCRQVFSGLIQLKNFRLSSLGKVFSLMGKKEKIAVAVLLLVAVSSALWSGTNFYYSHTKPVPGFGGSYTEGLLGQPSYINPLLAHQDADLALVELIYSGLYTFDSRGNIVPDLADGMPNMSGDQKQYTINLKRNVKWQNDKPFTADDVVFTIQTLKDPAYKSPLRNLWLSTEVEKLSDYSVKFSTKDISGPFIYNLTLSILPKAVWGKVDPQNFLLAKTNLEAIGTGPYAIKEIQKLSSGKISQITLNAFNNYYSNRAKISSVILKFYSSEEDMLNALHSKEINGFGFQPLGSNLYLEKGQAAFRLYDLPLPQYQVLFFNVNSKILSDQNVRQALALALDRQKIIQDVFKGNALLPAYPFAMSGQPYQSGQDFSVKTDQAKQLLDSSGWKVDPNTGIRTKKNNILELNVYTNDFLPNSKAAELVAIAWRNINIKINLNVLPVKELTDNIIRPRKFDVLLFPQHFGSDPDPFPFWHSSQVKDPGLNLTGFSDSTADQLISEARNTTHLDIRQQKYQAFSKLIEEKVPAVFLDQTIYVYGISNNVNNVGLNKIFDPSQRFLDLPNWYMETKRVWK